MADKVDVFQAIEDVLAEMARDGHALDMHYEALDQARAAIVDVFAASRRVRDAFVAHGKSSNAISDRKTRRECENALVALDEALASLAGASR